VRSRNIGMDLRTLFSSHAAAKASSHPIKPQSSRGVMENGLLEDHIHFRAFLRTPGAARGIQWLGTTHPALPHEHPEQISPRSTSITFRPALAA